MPEIYTDIIIRSSIDRVWRILIDKRFYPNWNPFIREISGKFSEGESIDIVLTPPGISEKKFSSRVEVYKPYEKIEWIGRLGIPFLFDGRHSFEIKDIGKGRVKLIHKEKFTGIFVPFLFGILGRTKQGFRRMNLALKKRAEKKR